MVNVIGLLRVSSSVSVMGNTGSKRIVEHAHPSMGAASICAMKNRQCAKIAELRQVLLRAGYASLDKQASALGLSRSTTWAVLRANHKSSGLSGSVIKRMVRSRELPTAARQWIEEYVAEKLAGTYGHGHVRLRIFRAQVARQLDGVSLEEVTSSAAPNSTGGPDRTASTYR